eukprot:Nk52_evm31s242 gene=Nk52_evmTU31s242
MNSQPIPGECELDHVVMSKGAVVGDGSSDHLNPSLHGLEEEYTNSKEGDFNNVVVTGMEGKSSSSHKLCHCTLQHKHRQTIATSTVDDNLAFVRRSDQRRRHRHLSNESNSRAQSVPDCLDDLQERYGKEVGNHDHADAITPGAGEGIVISSQVECSSCCANVITSLSCKSTHTITTTSMNTATNAQQGFSVSHTTNTDTATNKSTGESSFHGIDGEEFVFAEYDEDGIEGDASILTYQHESNGGVLGNEKPTKGRMGGRHRGSKESLQSSMSSLHACRRSQKRRSMFHFPLKNKLMCLWANIRHKGRVGSARFNKKTDIWLLGVKYGPPDPDQSLMMFTGEDGLYSNVDMYVDYEREEEEDYHIVSMSNGDSSKAYGHLKMFKKDYQSKLWFTYRRKVREGISGSKMTSDVGWGCMIRCGQMMVAQGLVMKMLGRHWRTDSNIDNDETFLKYNSLLKLFDDVTCSESPFSIHNICSAGERIAGKRIGEWFGPSSVAIVLSYLVNNVRFSPSSLQDPKTHHAFKAMQNFVVYNAVDRALYLDEIASLCCDGKHFSLSSKATVSMGSQKSSSSRATDLSEDPFSPLMILLPVRLGVNKMNTAYHDAIKRCFELPYTVGMIGGRPRHAVYFVGYQDNELICLDPHPVSNVPTVAEDCALKSANHCKYPRKVPLISLDPSVCFGFFCKTKAEFEDFCIRIDSLNNNCMHLLSIMSEKNSSGDVLNGMSCAQVNEDVECSGKMLNGVIDDLDEFEIV